MSKGFTLVETVIAIVVIAIGVFGTMNLFYQTLGSSLNSPFSMMATWLAREQLEKVVFDKKMKGFNFIDPKNYKRESLPGPFEPFSRTTEIVEVDGSDLTTPKKDSGTKRVTVEVSWSEGSSVALETLVTQWGKGG